MPRKSKEFLRRSAAAKKGWRERSHHGIEIELGYHGRRGNSYTLRVAINTYRKIENLSDRSIATLVENLARQGHFDSSTNNPVSDLRWIGVNSWEITKENVKIKPGHAELLEFSRRSPGSLE